MKGIRSKRMGEGREVKWAMRPLLTLLGPLSKRLNESQVQILIDLYHERPVDPTSNYMDLVTDLNKLVAEYVIESKWRINKETRPRLTPRGRSLVKEYLLQ